MSQATPTKERSQMPQQKNSRFALVIGLTIAFRIAMEFSVMKAWSTSATYTFMALYALASIALCLLLLLNKKIPTLYRILGILGVVLLMYTSSQFISSTTMG